MLPFTLESRLKFSSEEFQLASACEWEKVEKFRFAIGKVSSSLDEWISNERVVRFSEADDKTISRRRPNFEWNFSSAHSTCWNVALSRNICFKLKGIREERYNYSRLRKPQIKLKNIGGKKGDFHRRNLLAIIRRGCSQWGDACLVFKFMWHGNI